MILDTQPEPFFLGYHRLGQKLYNLRMKVVESFKNFNYARITPILREIFHDDDIGVANSGILELFPPPKRGRPKKSDVQARKRKRSEYADVDYVSTQPKQRRLRRRGTKRSVSVGKKIVDSESSGENKIFNVSTILLQARDAKSQTMKLFVEWEGEPISDAPWIPLSNLTTATADWWRLEKERLYPCVEEDDFPSVPISGAPIAVTAHLSSVEESDSSSNSDSE